MEKALHKRGSGRATLAAMLLCAAVMAGCDDGKIYPVDNAIDNTGFTVTMKGDVSGCEKYEGMGYSVVLAAFKEGETYASVSKRISDGNGDVVLSNVDSEVSTVEVCVISRLRERVVTIASMPVSQGVGSEVTFNVGVIDVAPFPVISKEIFNTTCAQCHGATGTAAAGLDLMADKAYADLVNVPSSVVEGAMRVLPGDASASTLWEAVATDVSESWKFDHSNLLTPEKAEFIEKWINNGADD